MSKSDEDNVKSTVKRFVEDSYNFNGIEKNLNDIGDNNFKRILHRRNTLKQKNNNKDSYIVNKVDYKFKFDNISKKNDRYVVYLHLDEFMNYDIPSAKHEFGYVGNDYEIYLEKKGEKFIVDSANINVDCDPTDAEFNINKELGYKPRWEPEYSHDSVSGYNEKSASNSKNEVIKPLNDFSNEDNLGIRVSKIMQHFEKLSHYIDDRDNPKNIVVAPGCKRAHVHLTSLN